MRLRTNGDGLWVGPKSSRGGDIKDLLSWDNPQQFPNRRVYVPLSKKILRFIIPTTFRCFWKILLWLLSKRPVFMFISFQILKDRTK